MLPQHSMPSRAGEKRPECTALWFHRGLGGRPVDWWLFAVSLKARVSWKLQESGDKCHKNIRNSRVRCRGSFASSSLQAGVLRTAQAGGGAVVTLTKCKPL